MTRRGGGRQRERRERSSAGRPRGRAQSQPQESGETVVRLKSLLGSPHPWIWRSRIQDPPRVPGGEVVLLRGPDGQALGRGLYHPHVTIALRILTRDPDEAIDQGFFFRRFEAARRLREDVLRLLDQGNSYRLIHAEGDEISGLVIDVLGEVVRVDAFAKGIALLEEPIRGALRELYPDKAIVVRGDRRSGEIERFDVAPRRDDPAHCEVRENGVRYRVDLREGHKTGFFLDQRENRQFLASLSAGKRVLDVCTYSGGFALAAAVTGKAREVTGVDLDEKAIEVAKRNAKLNQAKVRFVHSDGFPYLRQVRDKPNAQRPEVLVLDPPKFASDLKEKDEGLRAYADLNRAGLDAMADEGLLCTCSCSGVVSEEDLLDALRSAAARSGRLLKILRVSGAAADHPVALHAPESRYLKAVFAHVRKQGG